MNHVNINHQQVDAADSVDPAIRKLACDLAKVLHPIREKPVNPKSTASNSFSRYAFSCGLLLIPAIAWNLAFTSKLMPAPAMAEFWRDIPAPLTFTENALRALVFGLPFVMPLQIASKAARRALGVFALGTLVYFASWLALMYWPHSAWSTSALGSLAPAYTPVLWLPSLGVLGQRLFWGRFYRGWMYLLVCAAFLAAHITHAAMVSIRSS